MEPTASFPKTSRHRVVSQSECKRSRSRCRSTKNHERSLHRNQQYSITAITNGGGSIIERYAYSAYGTATIADANGTAISTQQSAIANRYTYTGREYDETLDLYNYRARMYDSVLGRFCSRDPYVFIDGLNVYKEYFALNTQDPYGTSIDIGTFGNNWLEGLGLPTNLSLPSLPGGDCGSLEMRSHLAISNPVVTGGPGCFAISVVLGTLIDDFVISQGVRAGCDCDKVCETTLELIEHQPSFPLFPFSIDVGNFFPIEGGCKISGWIETQSQIRFSIGHCVERKRVDGGPGPTIPIPIPGL